MALMMSLNESMFQSVPGAGILLGGAITALGSPRTALAVAGAGSLLVTAVAWFALTGRAMARARRSLRPTASGQIRAPVSSDGEQAGVRRGIASRGRRRRPSGDISRVRPRATAAVCARASPALSIVRRACIDIGSNTTRLLVADCDGERLLEVHQERAFTHVRRGLTGSGGARRREDRRGRPRSSPPSSKRRANSARSTCAASRPRRSGGRRTATRSCRRSVTRAGSRSRSCPPTTRPGSRSRAPRERSATIPPARSASSTSAVDHASSWWGRCPIR